VRLTEVSKLANEVGFGPVHCRNKSTDAPAAIVHHILVNIRDEAEAEGVSC
jgi:hypothetical protein